MKKLKTTGALVMLVLIVSCGTAKEQGAQENSSSERTEEMQNGRSGLPAEILESKPDFVLEVLDDGQAKVVFYGYDFNMETRTIGSEKKAFYVESPESVNFYFQRVIEGVNYSVYKLENGVVAVPQ